MRRFLVSVALLFVCAGAFAFSFPALTGRVVDDAHILSSATIQNIDQSLAAYEHESTNQVVVATIPSLQGGTIEDYGYQLGRFWGIGQKGKDNGVILIVAPNERKMRIEVGYGLEGTLTDALSSQIIQTIILPDFRQGQMERGVVDGTNAIVEVLGGHSRISSQAVTDSTSAQGSSASSSNWGTIIYFVIVLGWLILRFFLLPWWFPISFPFSAGVRGGSFSGGSFGGGFSGGGGSFGGGGASGGW